MIPNPVYNRALGRSFCNVCRKWIARSSETHHLRTKRHEANRLARVDKHFDRIEVRSIAAKRHERDVKKLQRRVKLIKPRGRRA